MFNLADIDRISLARKREEILRSQAKENLKTSTGGNDPRPLAKLPKPAINTRKESAKVAGVGERITTERRLGEALAAMEIHGSNQHGRKSPATTSSLSDLGITKDQSHRWQKLAGIIVAAMMSGCQ